MIDEIGAATFIEKLLLNYTLHKIVQRKGITIYKRFNVFLKPVAKCCTKRRKINLFFPSHVKNV